MSTAVRLGRSLRALRHYRMAQVWQRLWIRTRRQWHSLAPGGAGRRLATAYAGPPPLRSFACSDALCDFARHPEVSPPSDLDDLLSGRFTFLGETHPSGQRPDWSSSHPPRPTHLWRMNLHYHRFVVHAAVAGLQADPATRALALSTASRLLEDWQRSCLYGDRWTWQDAWHPFSASARLLNGWLARRLLLRVKDAAALELAARLDARAAADATLIADWLEWDLGGNHLLRNAAALLAAGCWFAGTPGDRWRRKGERLLQQELSVQILADGFHEERSPMYHAQLVEDLLVADDRAANGSSAARNWLPEPLAALEAMLHPDGQIALLNDAAFGITAPPAQLRALASSVAPPGPRPADLPAAGYFWFRDGQDALVFDAGALGPNHLPAHAHCDALSFEYSADGRRIFVDTGVDRYEAGPERQFQRSTAAHSTLQVQDREQGEVFSSFRMGRRPTVHGKRVDATCVEGRHDGFQPFGWHARRIRWRGRDGFEWEDRLEDCHEVGVTVRIGLAPGLEPRVDGNQVRIPAVGILLSTPAEGQVAIEESYACERFGVRADRAVIHWRGTAGQGGRPRRFMVQRCGG